MGGTTDILWATKLFFITRTISGAIMYQGCVSRYSVNSHNSVLNNLSILIYLRHIKSQKWSSLFGEILVTCSAPAHYLQKALSAILKRNLSEMWIQNTLLFIQGNAFDDALCKNVATLIMGQSINHVWSNVYASLGLVMATLRMDDEISWYLTVR